MQRFRAIVVAVCAIALGAPVAAPAAITQTFTTSQSEFTPGVRNQGWWSATFANGDDNDNYFAGVVTLAGPTPVVLRNFFSFDLSSACRAATVTLQLTRFTQTGPLPYSLFDVSTPAPVLNANDVVSAAIFADLGTGTSFGSFEVATGSPGDLLDFPLNGAGVTAFNATRGDFFSLGGSTGAAEGSLGDAFIYGNSERAGTQQLIVTCLPENKEECNNGGWRDFGDAFKNQGQCVAFVQRGPKP
jgi:hypothetical protein